MPGSVTITLIVVGAVLVFPLAVAGLSAAPWIPARKRDLDRFVRLMDLHDGETVVDLGSGDGRLVVAATRSAKITARGVEMALPLVFFSRIRIALAGVRRSVRIRWGNLFREDLSDADVVVCFLMPKALERLEPKLERELKKGARFVSYAFPLPTKKADAADQANNRSVLIYRYRYDGDRAPS